MLTLDAIRKLSGLPNSFIGVIYAITAITYIAYFCQVRRRSRIAPVYLPVWATILSLWCVLNAIIEQIPIGMASLGWTSYVFFVPLLYVGAEVMADDRHAERALRMVSIAGGIIGIGAIASALLGTAAPPLLEPITTGAGLHSFGGGSVYLSPSIFATAEEASEQLLVALFAWIALTQLPRERPGRKLVSVLGVLIIGGLVFTARRTDLAMAVVGVIVLLALGRASSHRAVTQHLPKRIQMRTNASIAFLITAVGAIVLLSLLGASKLVPFLTSGSPQARLALMFSPTNPSSFLGQGPGTSVQGANLVGAIPFYGATDKATYIGYSLNGRTFITAEGGLTKTWLELGIVGVALYGAVFLSALRPTLRRLRRLDSIGRACLILTLALGIIFLKGHQSLDDPLVQPLFWLAAGGSWGRMRALAPGLQKDTGANRDKTSAEGPPEARAQANSHRPMACAD